LSVHRHGEGLPAEIETGPLNALEDVTPPDSRERVKVLDGQA
jgi:hypothetical protein